MGISHTKLFHKEFDPAQWHYTSDTKGRSSKVLKNRCHGGQIEEYTVSLSSASEMQACFNVFYWRLGAQHLVSSINYHVLNQSGACGQSQILNMHLERIVKRLPEMGQLTQVQAVYMLIGALHGFHEIYDRFGYVDIEENMFCLNNDRKVKVWMSVDLVAHKPRMPYMVRAKKTQVGMVQAIVEMVCKHIIPDHKNILKEFLAGLCPNPKFNEAKFLVKMYAKQQQMQTQRSFETCNNMKNIKEAQSTMIKSDISKMKNSLSRMLSYKQKDYISEKDKAVSMTASRSPNDGLNKTYSYKTHTNVTTDWATNSHARQQSAPPFSEFDQEKQPYYQTRNGLVRHQSNTHRMETILSNLTTPEASVTDPQMENQGIQYKIVVVPALPLYNISKGFIQVPSIKNTQTTTFLDSKIRSRDISQKSIHNEPHYVPTINMNEVPLKENIMTEAPPKLSLKNIRKSREEAKPQFKNVRRTISICVSSAKKLNQYQAQRHHQHSSELAYNHNKGPNEAVSYQVITSESENHPSTVDNHSEQGFGFVNKIHS